jgi:hypothetical protein
VFETNPRDADAALSGFIMLDTYNNRVYNRKSLISGEKAI